MAQGASWWCCRASAHLGEPIHGVEQAQGSPMPLTALQPSTRRLPARTATNLLHINQCDCASSRRYAGYALAACAVHARHPTAVSARLGGLRARWSFQTVSCTIYTVERHYSASICSWSECEPAQNTQTAAAAPQR